MTQTSGKINTAAAKTGEEGRQMSIWEHVNELRKRLFRAVIGLVLTTTISFSIASKLLEMLAVPIGGLGKLQSIEITENMGVYMKVSLLSGFIFALPYILYQLLAFIMPGLKPGEKRWVIMAIPLATLLFVIGVAFSYFVMLPAAIPFLTNFLSIPTTPRLSNYFNFITNLMFWIGIAFEAPLVVFVLAKLRMVSAKALLKQWRIAIVVIAAIAALITPTVDPVNMGLLMLPLFLIYLLSAIFAWLARRNEENGI
ncbi:MAG TPA: twin-arginine translocase subunit TatC [Anaerolineaceae bacterium]|nr:twin-arginine translocase subunit TatC [Anaerolineaceae bacterium]HQN03871.1 twin-arginine translocase subunit TatC [Anaerolineaceae bacterium]